MNQILCTSSAEAKFLEIRGLLIVGGKNSSGHTVAGLKFSEDYVILSESGDTVFLHSLREGKSKPRVLEAMKPVQVGDLTIVLVSENKKYASGESPNPDTNPPVPTQQLLEAFIAQRPLDHAMYDVLKNLAAWIGVEKGLVVTRNSKGEFTVLARQGVRHGDPWLTETVIAETLQFKKPLFVSDINGAKKNLGQSLIDCGFTSVFAWPLLVRGEVLGVLLLGSSFSHPGLSAERESQASLAIQFLALMTWFYLREQKLQEELKLLQNQFSPDDTPFLTSSERLLDTCRMGRRISNSELSIFIQGETGVGKELMARWVHEKSGRETAPFVAVNCGAIPSELLESTLFGHKKGAFTGAISDQIGKFQLARNGTLFLDEIGDLPEKLQVKLLRCLQEKTFEPVGSNRTIPFEGRVISASHKNLTELVRSKGFREDLYYRLAEVTLSIPALRERPDDIILLALHFLKMNNPNKKFSEAALSFLRDQSWKGNVRELQSTIKRVALLSVHDEIKIEDFQKGASLSSSSTHESHWLGGKDLEEAKSAFILRKVNEAIERSGGKKVRAAELLGITPRTLFRYLGDKEL